MSDLFDDDGVYHWGDGDRVVQIRPVFDGAGGTSAGAGSSLALTNDTLPRQFMTDTGQPMYLDEGVVVIFRSEAAISAALARHGIAAADLSPLNGISNGFFITASAVDSLRLAAGLAGDPAVVSASPNWHSPDGVEVNGGGTTLPAADSGGGADGDVAAIHATQAELGYCTAHLPSWMSDALSHCAWHLDADTSYRTPGRSYDPQVDINIGDAWDKTKGQGVTVAIVDHGWHVNNEDLRDNVDASLDWNLRGFNSEPRCFRIGFVRLCSGPIFHGTSVAGIIGARDNLLGGRGVAPRATLTNFDYLDLQTSATTLEAWTRHSDVIGVSNHSYGPYTGPGLRRAEAGWVHAVESALSSGYGGLGTVFTKAAGNDKNDAEHPYSGLASLEERQNHRGLIVVCAVGASGTSSYYSNEGPTLWLCAPSNGSSNAGLIAPMGKDDYTLRFGGTSGAAPQVAGVAALVRSVNPYLTWRDVKLLLADTAFKNDPSDSSWLAGAAKYSNSTENYSFSHKYGFGVPDAEAAVDAAFSWPLLPEAKSTAVSSPDIDATLDTRVTEYSLNVQSSIDFVEHVNLDLDMLANKIRDFDITLVSPAGRESAILTHAPQCSRSCGIDGSFTFGSARHLGEDPSGTWTLRLEYGTSIDLDSIPPSELPTMRSWRLTVHGHTSSSAALAPALTLSVGSVGSIEPTVSEGDDLQVTVNVHNGVLTQDLVVPVVVTPQTASPSSDYSPVSSVTIPAGSTSGTAVIPITDDQHSERSETFMVGLGTVPAGYQALGVASTVTIADDDTPIPEVSISAGPGVTEGQSAQFMLSASPAQTRRLEVQVLVSQTDGLGAPVGRRSVWLPIPATDLVPFNVPTVDDKWDRPDGSVTVKVLPGEGYTVGQSLSASVAVADNDASIPEVSISAGPGVTEGERAMFTLSIQGGKGEPVPLPIIVTQSGEFVSKTPSKYVVEPKPGPVLGLLFVVGDTGREGFKVPAGENSYQFAVSTADDGDDEANGSISVQVLEHPHQSTLYGWHTVGSSSSATVSVADNDADLPTVSVSAGAEVSEGGTARFTLTASPGLTTALSVKVRVAQTGDFGTVTGLRTVSMPTSGSASFTVKTTDDSLDEADGQVSVEVLDGSGYWAGSPSTASVSVADDDDPPPSPVVSITGGAAATEGGDVSFTVSADPAPADPLPVTVTVTASGDYGAVTGTRTVTVPTGGSATFTVTTADDSADEPDGSVTATLVDGADYDLGAAKTATVSVADDDDPPPPPPPVVTIAAGAGVTEGGGAVFTVSASPAPAAPLTVKVRVAASGDFGAVTSTRSVIVPADGSVSFTVATVDDGADEADGSVSAQVLAGSGYTVGSTSSASVDVADDDDPPRPEVTAETHEADPGVAACAGKPTVTVADATARRGEDLEFVISLSCRHSRSITAYYYVAFGDKWFPSASVTFDSGDTSATVRVPTASARDVKFNVVWVPGAAIRGGEADGTIIEAADTPPPTPVVTIAGGTGVTEGGDASYTVTANPPPTASLPVQVKVTQVGDYGAVTGTRTVTVPVGGTVTFTVATADDSVDEADGSVTATLIDGAGYVLGAAKTATVNVADDDDPAPQVNITAGSGGTEGTNVVFTITAGSAPAADVDVGVAIAVSGDFGVTAGSRTATISSGATQTTLTIATADDGDDEPDGSVTAALVAGSGYTVGPLASETVQVLDDDDPPLVIPEISIAAAGDVTEGSEAVFTITATPAASVPVAVTVTAAGDYGATAGPRTVNVPAGGSATLTIPTTDDSVDEADGSVSVSLDAPGADAGYTVPAAQGSATVGVADDDVDPLTVYMIFFSTSIDEDGTGYDNQAGLNIGLTRTLRSWETVTVPLSVTGGNEGAHWTMRNLHDPDAAFANEFEVVFGPGDQRVELALTAVADSDWDDQEITVSYGTAGRAPTLNGSTDGMILGISWGPDGTERADGSTTVVIIDSDEPPPEVNITASSGGTEGTDATFTITASKPATADLDITVDITTTGHWGTTTGQRTATIPTGATQATLTITTTNDDTDEPDGSITATLTAGSGYKVGQQATQTAQILDDDDPPPEPAIAACTGKPRVTVADAAAQQGQDLHFEISLSCRPTGDVTVYYAVAHDRRLGSVITITINKGETGATVNVPTQGINADIEFHIVYLIGAANNTAKAKATITP
ncbi:S8 family serine peptidase [Candidatus Poriferisocius sp.]|uniref:S8 family serine peptidase n=1 Tax=Candidatus Poriferisocius sp. TaxID=3101276 RepID=UPI003B027D44